MTNALEQNQEKDNIIHFPKQEVNYHIPPKSPEQIALENSWLSAQIQESNSNRIMTNVVALAMTLSLASGIYMGFKAIFGSNR